MQIFVRVVQTGSFSGAARETQTTQSTVSKKVAALEAHLGAQLLSRNSRSLSLTATGEVFFRKCQKILEEVWEAEVAVGSPSLRVSRPLRVTMSPVLSRRVMAPILSDFLASHENVKLAVYLTEDHCDIAAEGIDVAIRARYLKDSSLIARPLSSNPLCLVASPDYLERRGEPLHPSDLDDHDCLIFSRLFSPSKWEFRKGRNVSTVSVDGSFRCDQGDTLVTMALLGRGIVLMPPWLMNEYIESGRLKVLLSDWRAPNIPINVVYPKQPHMPSWSRSFIDFVLTEVRRRGLLPP